MAQILSLVLARALNPLRSEKGVVMWEYMLVIAGVSVAIIAIVAVAGPSLTHFVVRATCGAINTILPSTSQIVGCATL